MKGNRDTVRIRIAIGLLLVAHLTLIGCAPTVSYVPLAPDKRYQPTQSVDLIPLGQPAPARAEVIGELSVGDSGLSVGCGLDDVLNLARAKARAAGANAIRVVRMVQPDFSSSCYRITAHFLKYAASGSWETLALDEAQAREYFDAHQRELDPVEGVWSTLIGTSYRLAIKKGGTPQGRDFVGFVLQTDAVSWKPGQVKMELSRTAIPGMYSATYFLGDFSRQGSTAVINDQGVLEIPLRLGTQLETVRLVRNYPLSSPTSPNAGPAGRRASTSVGSGFLLTEGGLVCTNWHVVEGATSLEVFFPQRARAYRATVAMRDARNDLAILRLDDWASSEPGGGAIPYRLKGAKGSRLGEQVYTLGFPLGDTLGTSAKVSTGTLSSLMGMRDDPRVLQISVPIQPGNSGGPLFDARGDVIGVVVATLNAKYFLEQADIVPQNVSFAVKAEYLESLLSLLPGAEAAGSRQSRLGGKRLEDQVEAVAPFIVAVKAK